MEGSVDILEHLEAPELLGSEAWVIQHGDDLGRPHDHVGHPFSVNRLDDPAGVEGLVENIRAPRWRRVGFSET